MTELRLASLTEEHHRKFWKRVQRTEGCWIWTGSCQQPWGYGHVRVNRKLIKAHRLSYVLHYGEIPPGQWVLHHCDNPPCVRPDHLFLGTHQDNTNDKMQKGRWNGAIGDRHPNWNPVACPRGHPYTPDNLKKNSRMHGLRTGTPWMERVCRICANAARRRQRARRKLEGRRVS